MKKRLFLCGVAGVAALLLTGAEIRVNPAMVQNLSPSGDDLAQLKKLTLGAGWEFSPNEETTAALKRVGVRKIRCINVDLLPGSFDDKGNYLVDRTQATRLDAHLATCRETGAIPHIIIGQRLPEAIRNVIRPDSDEGRIMGLKRNQTVGPTDYEKYRNYQLAFFEHVMITLGCRNAVFEAFNEPDIGGVPSPTAKIPARGSAELYDAMFRLYREISAAARLFEQRHPDAPLTLGGPALAWAFTFRFGSFNWGERFIQDTAKEKLKLDFIGVHFYGNITSLYGEYPMPYPPFPEMLGSLKRARDKALPGVPIQINEWGASYHVNTTEQALVNADHIGAAWSAEFLKIMLEEGVDDALYLVTTDLAQPGKDGKLENVWGWCSLFTNPKACGKAWPKAAFHLFRMVSALEGRRVESTRSGTLNSFAAADPATGKLRILVWNFGARIPENGLPLETAAAETAAVTIIDAGKFFGSDKIRMSRRLISRDTGNACQIWRDGKSLTAENTALPVTDTGEFQLLGNDLQFGLLFPSNSVGLIELERVDGASLPPPAAVEKPAPLPEKAKTPQLPPTAPSAVQNAFADPDFLRQTASGKNGTVYVNAEGGLERLPEGGIRIDSAHRLTMQPQTPKPGETIVFGLNVRGNAESVLTLQINFMSAKKMLSSPRRQVRLTSDWQPGELTATVPAECDRIFLLLSGGPAEVKGLMLKQ